MSIQVVRLLRRQWKIVFPMQWQLYQKIKSWKCIFFQWLLFRPGSKLLSVSLFLLGSMKLLYWSAFGILKATGALHPWDVSIRRLKDTRKRQINFNISSVLFFVNSKMICAKLQSCCEQTRLSRYKFYPFLYDISRFFFDLPDKYLQKNILQIPNLKSRLQISWLDIGQFNTDVL